MCFIIESIKNVYEPPEFNLVLEQGKVKMKLKKLQMVSIPLSQRVTQ